MTLLLRERVDAHRVQRLLRHRDVKTTTGTYGHLVVEDLREAINLLPPAPFAASLLQDPGSTPIYRLCTTGELPHFRVGATIRIRDADLARYCCKTRSTGLSSNLPRR